MPPWSQWSCGKGCAGALDVVKLWLCRWRSVQLYSILLDYSVKGLIMAMVDIYVALFRIIFRPLASKQWCTPPSRSSSFIWRGVVWSNAHIPHPAIPDPSHWGCHLVSKRWQSLWMSKPVIFKALKQLVSCGWAKKYKLPCNWCVADVSCTTLCACRGHYYQDWFIYSLDIHPSAIHLHFWCHNYYCM